MNGHKLSLIIRYRIWYNRPGPSESVCQKPRHFLRWTFEFWVWYVSLTMQRYFWSFLLLLVLLTTLIRSPGSWTWRRRGSQRRHSCVPQHCVLDVWRNVGSCSSTCGWGKVLQIRNVRTYQACGGTVCPSPSSPQRRRNANC